MKKNYLGTLTRLSLMATVSIVSGLMLASSLISVGNAYALSTKATAKTTSTSIPTTTISAIASTSTSTPSSADKCNDPPTTATGKSHLSTMISKGDQEIQRRLTNLSGLTSIINSATKLTASDKATLSAEVSSTTNGLTLLESQLNSETTICSARTDVSNIYSEYRVYALVDPKVRLIKVADDQQVVEDKLQSLSQKLQARITADQQAGKGITSLQSDLTNLNTQVAASLAISSNIESSVISLQPSDYNSNHDVLEGDVGQLKTAHSDNVTALTDAKNIVAGLKSL